MNEPVADGVGGKYPEPPVRIESGRDRMTGTCCSAGRPDRIPDRRLPDAPFHRRHIGQAGLGFWISAGPW